MKNYVITYRSILSFFIGFMSYAFIALMKISGLSDFQIGLVLSSIQISQFISYVVLIALSVKRHIMVSAVLELFIPIILIVDRSAFTFVLSGVLMGIANSINSSVIIIQKEFTRKDYSVLMALTYTLSLAGLGIFYLSGIVGVSVLFALFIPLLFSNLVLALTLRYEEKRERLSDIYHWLKGVGKSVLAFGFFTSLRRVIIGSYIPLILLITFSVYTPQEISLYLMVFQVPLIIFFYVGHKISEKLFMVLSVVEFILFLVLSVFYRESILLALSLILLANMTSSLRAPVAEETVIKLSNFSTKISSFYHLIDTIFSALAAILLALIVKLGLFYGIFIMAGLSSFLPSLFLYKVLLQRKQ
ncbi:hypothetical protein [Stygiolobus caldivivus]|uniref:MFS transporter n=1 Tax=Stygiolobus caldivivus TaxID=2824673 RepID=A0A8D5ZKT5_9CREN|nr:hypothetical protein [Stygiolobus caldivivus]BCU71612.1 hypothetical protein KN1_29090 [Stygiolobus caldivivus]